MCSDLGCMHQRGKVCLHQNPRPGCTDSQLQRSEHGALKHASFLSLAPPYRDSWTLVEFIDYTVFVHVPIHAGLVQTLCNSCHLQQFG